MATRTFTLAPQVRLPVDTWLFSNPVGVPERINAANIRITSTAGDWFDPAFVGHGFIKFWGMMLQGSDINEWDSDPIFGGYGFILWEPSAGDVRDPRIIVTDHPEVWIPYGRKALKSNAPSPSLGWSRAATPVPPGATVRLGVMVTGLPIRLGAVADVES